jgi:hypothetical protein
LHRSGAGSAAARQAIHAIITPPRGTIARGFIAHFDAFRKQ